MQKKNKEALFAYTYILPGFILLLTFYLIPILMDVVFSFTKYNVIQSPKFIGMKNFQRLISDKFILAGIKNTLIYSVITVPIQTIISLTIAALLASKFKSSKFGEFTRSALFIPVIASAVLISTLWLNLLASNGPINYLIKLLGGEPINWLGDKVLSLVSVIMTAICKTIGYFLVIFYAGILNIPGSLYEAAEVDGASRWQQFCHITIPGLSSVTYMVITLGTIWSFQVFDIVYTMTGGGPGMSTVTLVLTIYTAAFKEYNMGYASAIALLLFLIVLFVQFLQKKIMKGGEND